MSLSVTQRVIQLTTEKSLSRYRVYDPRLEYSEREISVAPHHLSDEALDELRRLCVEHDDKKTARAIDSILLARTGNFAKSIPNFEAFSSNLQLYLMHDIIDGWIYARGADGELYPELVTRIQFDNGESHHSRHSVPTVILHTSAISQTGSRGSSSVGQVNRTYHFVANDATRKSVADALAAKDLFKETADLKGQYLKSLEWHEQVVIGTYGKQFRFEGNVFYADGLREDGISLPGQRVIQDLDAKEVLRFAPLFGDSILFEGDHENEGVGKLPIHPVARVFDLKLHTFYWVNTGAMKFYEYDKSLRNKLILPASHRDLLDILTSNLNVFVDDIIEGKSAGNVIICKGLPGVGKTLTAEVYAELIESPLYAIHSGSLGVSASDIEKNLQVIFKRAQGWGCVLLLDECDVFVAKRGSNIQQNAIVAEFLRTLEYFRGLMFMTTNRPDDIDDAIISRCAAIIDYQVPNEKDRAAIWNVMANQFGVSLSAELVGQLITTFPKIAPRDIKMLLRLALRVAQAEGVPLDIEIFRRCAMFRAIEISAE